MAILDDDDSWDSDYIENIHTKLFESPKATAIFAFIRRSDCENDSTFDKKELTITNFLCGNPGIQGSNMCFRIDCLLRINGFDENLSSCTDRDLMIRFLSYRNNLYQTCLIEDGI